MEEKKEKQYKPFAITARTDGKPKKLYTKMLLVNMEPQNGKMHGSYVNAMWDTGAEYCVMTTKLAEKLGFEFKHEITAKGINGEIVTKTGFAYVALVSNGQLIETRASIVNEEWGEYSFIIGMDFISKGTLAISSTPIDTTLSFTIPSPGRIDFVKILEKRNIKGKYIPLSSDLERIDVLTGVEILDKIIPDEDQISDLKLEL